MNPVICYFPSLIHQIGQLFLVQIDQFHFLSFPCTIKKVFHKLSFISKSRFFPYSLLFENFVNLFYMYFFLPSSNLQECRVASTRNNLQNCTGENITKNKICSISLVQTYEQPLFENLSFFAFQILPHLREKKYKFSLMCLSIQY